MEKTPERLLPRKPSALLRLAVADSIRVSKMKTRKLLMTTWHSFSLKGICQVCMAGAVMDRTLKVPARQTVEPIETKWADELIAIDRMRMGDFFGALSWLGLSDDPVRYSDELYDIALPVQHAYRWSSNERAPWRVYLNAARELEELGL